MRLRVGIAILLVAMGGGGLLIALRDGSKPPPAPPPEPPEVVLPLVLPVLEQERIPAEAPAVEDLGGPLDPLPKPVELPPDPVKIEVRDPDLELRTGSSGQGEPYDESDSERPGGPHVVEAQPDPPAEPEKPVKILPDLVPGKEVAPLPGPIEDPEDLREDLTAALAAV